MSKESKSSAVIRSLILRDFLNKRASFRVSSRSWLLDHKPITTGALAKIIADELDCAASRVANSLENLVHKLALEQSQALERWCTTNDRLPRCTAEMEKFLRLMERPNTSELAKKANELALRQWLWQVKRGILRQPARWHVALVFWSKENGTGKSYNLQRLFSPIKHYTRHVNVDDLGEKFSGTMFANCLIAFLDEFAGAENICAANLKAILTGKPWDQRAIYSDSGFYAENHTSALASSNKEPPHGFVDHTGARRFWSIHCDGKSMERSIERALAFDSLDVDRIWAAVSSQDPSPHEQSPGYIRDYMETIRDKVLRSKTSLENFLDDGTECCEATFKLPMKEFVQGYKRYCTETRQVMLQGGYDRMAIELKNLHISVVRPSNRVYLKGRCLSTLESQ